MLSENKAEMQPEQTRGNGILLEEARKKWPNATEADVARVYRKHVAPLRAPGSEIRLTPAELDRLMDRGLTELLGDPETQK